MSVGSITLLTTAGCDQLPRELRSIMAFGTKESGSFRSPTMSEIDTIAHVLNRASFGARPGDYERIRKLASTPEEAAEAYLEQQLSPESIDDFEAEQAARRFETLSEPLGELFEYQPDLLENELIRATLTRAVYSERQLYEVMVQFWSDHFNIDPSKGECKWLKVADDRDVVRKHALGKFPDLLRASALSPAMLWYLDGRVNRKAKPDDKPNENYARELLELHTLGVHGGYTQKDVMEVARCLTGWAVRGKNNPPRFQIGKVEFQPEMHDFGPKQVLNRAVVGSLPANASKESLETFGQKELERLLKILTQHEATAKHISEKLCRHFIADEPPLSSINKVAAVFKVTGGDIRAVLRAVFRTEEFRESRGNKLKRPFHFVVSALRATDAKTDAGMPLVDYLRRMGHAPFNYPTPDGYPEAGSRWMGTLLWRWNFAVALSRAKIKGSETDLKSLNQRAGGDEQLLAHFLNRKPALPELQAYRDAGTAGLALALACPAFQRC